MNELREERHESGLFASDIPQKSSRKSAQLRLGADIAHNSHKGNVYWNPATFETGNQPRKLWAPSHRC